MQRNCDACGNPYEARSPRSKFCADTECKRARERDRNRRRATGDVVPFRARDEQQPQVDEDAGPNERATHRELAAAGRLETVAGVNAMTLARRLDRATGDTGQSFTALAKQHLFAVDRALEGVPVAGDGVDRIKDELRAKREKKAAGGKG